MTTIPAMPDDGYTTIAEALRGARTGQVIAVVDGKYIPTYAARIVYQTSPTLLQLADRLDELIVKIYPDASVEAEEPELRGRRQTHGYFLEMIQLAEDLRAIATL